MTEQPQDKSLVDEKLSDLYQQRDQAEPPAQLDAQIKASAHDALKPAQPEPISYSQKQHWYATAAMIAVVALMLHFIIDEAEQILPEPTLSDWQAAPGKTVESEQQPASSLADAETVAPATAPASPPALTKPAAPEKKAARKLKPAAPTEQVLMRERAESDSLRIRQQATGALQTPAKAKTGAVKPQAAVPQLDLPMLSAEAWQERIRRLLHDKQPELARQELKALIASWPDFRVDPQLLEQTDLLQAPVTEPVQGTP